MTRDELLELLHVERYTPLPRRAPSPEAEPEPLPARVMDDSEIATARRRRELVWGIKGWHERRPTTRKGAA